MKKRGKVEPGQAARVTLAVNLKRLMDDTKHLETMERLGKESTVAPSSIANMVRPSRGNPTLDNIAKVAAAFDLEPWQLLHPDLPGRVLKPSEAALYNALREALEKLTRVK